MISIELDTHGVVDAVDPSVREVTEALRLLLNRCNEENIRDVTLRLPRAATGDLEPALRPLMDRPFRFSAWFRTPPPARLAELFVSAGHHITIAETVGPDRSVLRGVMNSPAYASGMPSQVDLFLAMPPPPPSPAEVLNGFVPRAKTSITLGAAWNDVESGPSAMTISEEKEWVEVLLRMATWLTAREATVYFACGLPLCMFSTEQLGRLALLKVPAPLASCTPDLVVTLDGRMRACPRLPATGWVAMPAGVGLRELAGQLLGPSEVFAGFCGRASEWDCRSLATGGCGGGCRAHNALGWRTGSGVTASSSPWDSAGHVR
ncbi:MAG TPA: hypothetical protein VL486_11085 [Verrucomicrobiae bacterium]|nr:hypothetical protein [Verrucomicrobiae bacterium]